MMNNNKNYFHFTIGPVQGFVSQARRTRDFWAGSFILSWLSAVAIKAVEHQKGEIKFPHANENYMQWLVGKGKKGLEPKQGSIPNRFKGMVAEVGDNFEPTEVTLAVQAAWHKLAEMVWESDLGHLSPSSEAALIWERQIESFWDMSWVITENKADSSVLDQRKNWRSYTPPPEPGIKCMMMDGWQELSGTASPNRNELSAFWNGLREQNNNSSLKNDLKENEALCAMAFVKRRFSRYFNKLDLTMPQGWQLKGWKVPSAVPSVSYMAAVHWLEQVMEKAEAGELDKNLLNEFHEEAHSLTGQYGEWDSHIHCLEKYSKDYKRLNALDGNVFFDTQLENKNRFEDQEQAKKVNKLLTKINKTEGIKKTSPFYAALLMDGDSLGIHMSNPKKQDIISKALDNFTQAVPKQVQENNGFLIYAGGDDVLAILPLEDAIPCAIAIRKEYQQCFKAENANFITTISAAIQFVHIKTALIKILRDSHDLLDNVAKDKTGRDALAIRVWKPGGKQLEWTQPWDIALNSETGRTHIEEVADTFENEGVDEQFSNSFFYKIRERFSLLNPDATEKSVLSNTQAEDLMAMEYLNSGKSDLSNNNYTTTEQKIEAKKRIGKLFTQCRPITRSIENQGESNEKAVFKSSNQLIIDGALLVRFLVQKGAK